MAGSPDGSASSARAAAEALVRPGDVLAGKYRIERILGVGGMGVVAAAQHLGLRSMVAVKLLLPQAAALPMAAERFAREAQATAALRSEHVVRVIDVGALETGTPYMVMEYLSGWTLGDILKARGPLPIEEAIEYARQATAAMTEAHAAGIVHRDLKPPNLFVTTRHDGTPLLKVLDFGLAKVLDPAHERSGDASLTATGLVIGSAAYISPEQLHSLKLADARTDIWALGVILYEMLTGRRPFEAESTTGILAKILTVAPVPLRQVRPEIPPQIEAIVLRCLEKDTARRVQSVTEIAAALAPFGPAPVLVAAVPASRALHVPQPSRPAISEVEAMAVESRTVPMSAPAKPSEMTTLSMGAAPLEASARGARSRSALWPLLGGACLICLLAGVMIEMRLRRGGTVSAAGSTAPTVTTAATPTTAPEPPLVSAVPSEMPAPAPQRTLAALPSAIPSASAAPKPPTSTPEPTAKPRVEPSALPRVTPGAVAPAKPRDPFGDYR